MCPYCAADCIRYGKSNTGTSRFRCKSCKRTHVLHYVYRACHPSIPENVSGYLKEGCGIRGISRLLSISVSTVLRIILRIANRIRKPLVPIGKEYEQDELKNLHKNDAPTLLGGLCHTKGYRDLHCLTYWFETIRQYNGCSKQFQPLTTVNAVTYKDLNKKMINESKYPNSSDY